MSGSIESRSETQYRLRDDGYLFSDEYLTSGNKEVAENYLWPVSVLSRHREDTEAKIGYSDSVIRPGDVLEYCGKQYEEYLLVVGILPVPAQYSPLLEIKSSDRILCYSSNSESYRLFHGGAFINLKDQKLEHETGRYILHEGVGPLVETSTDIPADVTHPPKPIVGEAGAPTDSVKQKYPLEHPPEESITPDRATEPANPTPIEEYTNSIEQGDVREVLRQMPSNSCHGWITSPPYYEARDYGVDGQLGHESSVDEYVESLLSIINQLMRVVRNDGVGCLIVDDVYRGGSLEGIPQTIYQEVVKQGYEVIHHSPWTKPNGKPEAVNNRYTHTHEHILVIAQEGGEHYFDKENAKNVGDVFNISVGNTDTDHDAVFPVELPKQLIRTTIPNNVCPECGATYEKVYEVTDIRDLNEDRDQAARALDIAENKNLTDKHLRALRSVGLSGIGQAKRTQNGTGKNTNEVEELAAEAVEVLGSYAREFTSPNKEHTGYAPKCDCSVDSEDGKAGIVIDPFMGSGTTAVAARRLRKRWVGIELNEDYIATAQSRIGVDVAEPDKIKGDNSQNTLKDFC